jgi:hypothetical protein
MFGELAFTSFNGVNKWTPESSNLELGKLIKLQKYEIRTIEKCNKEYQGKFYK